MARRRWREGAGQRAMRTDIKVLYCFHQNNDDSKCEVAHTSPPIIPYKIRQTWKPGGEQMAPKLATVTIVLAMALTILTAITWAAPIWSPIFGPNFCFCTKGHPHARACAPILSVGSGDHSHDHTGDRTGGRDLGAGPHRMS